MAIFNEESGKNLIRVLRKKKSGLIQMGLGMLQRCMSLGPGLAWPGLPTMTNERSMLQASKIVVVQLKQSR